ncbi:MAG: hypothetical protein QM758_07235 [Armatimonas sp.]
MSKLKRLGIGAGITLVVLGALTGVWYKQHYILPPLVEAKVAPPNPNGFDTLQKAFELTVEKREGIEVSPTPLPGNDSALRYPMQPLAGRLKLAQANAASIAKTREALAQEYLIPAHISPEIEGGPFRNQARMLVFAGDAYTDTGNLPEAARCDLDAIELGVMVPRGGGVLPVIFGTATETLGATALNGLVDKLDARTARAAADRLAKIEQKRSPLPDNLHQESLEISHRVTKLLTNSPLTAWKNIEKEFGADASTAQLLPFQVAMTYEGPGPTIAALDHGINRVAEQSKLPWGPQRPSTKEPSRNPLVELIGSGAGRTEFPYRRMCTLLALLQTRLRLRAIFLETGGYPTNLESLPEDPFSPTRSPLGYRSDGKTFTLWSVGPDARDDNGKPIDTKNRNWQSQDGYKPGDVVAGINT